MYGRRGPEESHGGRLGRSNRDDHRRHERFDEDATPGAASPRRDRFDGGKPYDGRARPRTPHGPGTPNLTLASMPRVPRPTFNPRGAPESADPSFQSYATIEKPAVQTRHREASVARPLRTSDSRRQPAAYPRGGSQASRDASYGAAWRDQQGHVSGGWDQADGWSAEDGWGDHEAPTRQLAQRPALAAYQQGRREARPRINTRAIIRKASSPWWLARASLALVATVWALSTTLNAAGEPSQRFETFQAGLSSKPLHVVAQNVKPITSLLHPEQYDSPAQFQAYGPAACSPTALAEVLTAWGVPNATIGHMIDDLGPYLSPNWGLLDQQGFEVAAAKHHMRADISWNVTYNQILYLTNVLGVPVIVNFRRDYGYYHYFAGGHFLVVTGGDQQGVSIVDSSEYFIKYLPHDVFDGLWQWRGDGTAMSVVIVPDDFQYKLPPP